MGCMAGMSFIFPFLLVFSSIRFLYYGIVTLMLKKETCGIPYYGKMPEEEKERFDVSRIICIHSALVIFLSLLGLLVSIMYTFAKIRGLNPVTSLWCGILGLMALLCITVVVRIPIKLSKKKEF